MGVLALAKKIPLDWRFSRSRSVFTPFRVPARPYCDPLDGSGQASFKLRVLLCLCCLCATISSPSFWTLMYPFVNVCLGTENVLWRNLSTSVCAFGRKMFCGRKWGLTPPGGFIDFGLCLLRFSPHEHTFVTRSWSVKVKCFGVSNSHCLVRL